VLSENKRKGCASNASSTSKDVSYSTNQNVKEYHLPKDNDEENEKFRNNKEIKIEVNENKEKRNEQSKEEAHNVKDSNKISFEETEN